LAAYTKKRMRKRKPNESVAKDDNIPMVDPTLLLFLLHHFLHHFLSTCSSPPGNGKQVQYSYYIKIYLVKWVLAGQISL